MARSNVPDAKARPRTHEGGKAEPTNPLKELRRAVLSCMLFENTFYESGEAIAQRIADLCAKVEPLEICNLAIQARDEMYLRHVPLFLARQLARHKGYGNLVATTLTHVIQRADELGEFLAIYWKDNVSADPAARQPLTRGVKRGLAAAFAKFDEYALAKYDRDQAKVRLRDVLFMVHAKPRDAAQDDLWKRLIAGKLTVPDTWETTLSAGKGENKTADWTRLLTERKIRGLSLLRNLRNMEQAGVDISLIERALLDDPFRKILPFRFVAAAQYAPKRLEAAIEAGMLKAAATLPRLPGRTGLLIDVSGSMHAALSGKSELNRLDAAAALAIYLREVVEGGVEVYAFNDSVQAVPARRGFALRDAFGHASGGTYLKGALELCFRHGWAKLDRIIVVTDEQSQDGIAPCPKGPRGYVVNVAPYAPGVGSDNGWNKINGWSERIVDYIRLIEAEAEGEAPKE